MSWFTLRGRNKVNGQWNLFCIAHILKRSIAMPKNSPRKGDEREGHWNEHIIQHSSSGRQQEAEQLRMKSRQR
jgi:hypothetical protein